MTKVLY